MMTGFAFAHGGEVHPTTGLSTIGVAVAFDPVEGKGRPVTGRLTLTIPKGWHLYAHGAPDEFVPVSVTQQAGTVDSWQVLWPPFTFVTIENERMPVYEGSVTIPLEGTLAVDAPAVWKGTVTFQACGADLCLPPETREVRGELR
ncbi:MAG: protein-disulfide reductase DsbD N-terminal domain-containing protein [Nitrospinae bacterium]|nr:protein-disulfide reductase DsbD N-terminal domain-containing protein [Nitrospinota bacterium]